MERKRSLVIIDATNGVIDNYLNTAVTIQSTGWGRSIDRRERILTILYGEQSIIMERPRQGRHTRLRQTRFAKKENVTTLIDRDFLA